MTAISRRLRGLASLSLAVTVLAGQALAQDQTLQHPAEDRVPGMITRVNRLPDETRIHIAIHDRKGEICWYFSGADSPCLLDGENRYGFRGGDNITTCPKRRRYADGEEFVLRFDPLPRGQIVFHLIEGEGGENQLTGPVEGPHGRFWNFLKVWLD